MRFHNNNFPKSKFTGESPVSQNIPCCFWLIVSICIVVSSGLGIFIYHYYNNFWFKLPKSCPERFLTLKMGPAGPERELWGYASFWSYVPQNESEITKFAPKDLLANLEKTFKPLSLKPFEDLPDSCKSKIPSISSEQLQNDQVDPRTTEWEFPEGLGLIPSSLFTADLSSEFQFHDNVINGAQSVVNKAVELMKRRRRPHDATIPIYLSPITPEIEQFLSPKVDLDVRTAQWKTINDSMTDYRKMTNPMFIVIGEVSLMPEIAGDDVIRVSKVPDPVALSLISSGNGSIINHGLLPTFGALLARSNVTAHAMNQNLMDAAEKASLNWKAAVVY